MKSRLANTRTATVAFVVILALGLLFRSQVSAIMWHLIHGRDLAWDNHMVTVPFSWRPVSNAEGSSLILAHATVSGAESELRVTKKGQILRSADDASNWQRDSIGTFNDKFPPARQFNAYTVVTTGGDVFCIGSEKGDVAVSFVCRVVGTDWDIRFLGNDRDALDARSIVASLR
jgi:hypothetical protein